MGHNHNVAILKNRNRTVKQSGGSMHLHVDSEHTAGATATEGFSLYVGPWMTVNQDHRYTKHIYAGSHRIVSKVGDVLVLNATLVPNKAYKAAITQTVQKTLSRSLPTAAILWA